MWEQRYLVLIDDSHLEAGHRELMEFIAVEVFESTVRPWEKRL